MIRNKPPDTILASVPSISTPEPDDDGPDSSKVITEVYSLGSNDKIIGRKKNNKGQNLNIRLVGVFDYNLI